MNVLMVGTALDTNGQKARYVEAARRWGDDPGVLKALWAGRWDMAGVAGRFAEASTRQNGPLVIRSAHRSEYAFFQFPTDINWSRANQREVMQLAAGADVIHLTNDVKAYRNLRLHRLGKPAVIHHHGTLFRSDHKRLLADARRFGFLSAVSTIDLLRPAPDELHWLPTAYDLDMLAQIRREQRSSVTAGNEANGSVDREPVRIVSAPTNREIKSTALLEAVVAQLQAEGLNVELLLIEGRTWAECLTLKATADIYFDQLGLGYGCNAVEAWGMGIPVVAGADEWTLNRMRKEWNTRTLPFHEATPATLVDELRRLVQSPTLRKTVAARGMRHAKKYHAEKPALARLAELYGKAIALKEQVPTVDEFAVMPGRFRTERKPNLVLRFGSKVVAFDDNEAEVADPALAQRVRRLIAFDNRHQLSEVYETGDAA